MFGDSDGPPPDPRAKGSPKVARKVPDNPRLRLEVYNDARMVMYGAMTPQALRARLMAIRWLTGEQPDAPGDPLAEGEIVGVGKASANGKSAAD